MAIGSNTSGISNVLTQTLQNSVLFGGAAGAKKTQGIMSLLNQSKKQGASIQSVLDNQRTLNRTELALRGKASVLNAANAESVFNAKSVVSTKPEAVSATAVSGAPSASMTVSVMQLAQGQKTQGGALDAAAASQVSTTGGYGQLAFNTGGQEKLVTFQLSGSETNEEALGKIASAVNDSNMGITASVIKDSGGMAKLNLEGATGADNAFTVTDSVGNAAAVTGLDNPANTTQAAQNAVFSVNGAVQQSDTNKLAVTGGVTLDLKQTTGGQDVTVSVTGNSTSMETAVRELVSQYNQTLGALKANPSTQAQQSATNLQSAATQNASSLQSAGINVSSGGELKIDEAKFQSALSGSADTVKSAFNSGGGFARTVQTETERAINQSLATPIPGGFSSMSGTDSSYGPLTNNQFIASNIGLFMNSFM